MPQYNEFKNLYLQIDNTIVIKLRRTGWPGNVASTRETENTYSFGKNERKRDLKDLSVNSRIILKWANEISASVCADSVQVASS
jgi:hypothetical protein